MTDTVLVFSNTVKCADFGGWMIGMHAYLIKEVYRVLTVAVGV